MDRTYLRGTIANGEAPEWPSLALHQTSLGRSAVAFRAGRRPRRASWRRSACASWRPGASSARRNFSMATGTGLSTARRYEGAEHVGVVAVVVSEAELVEVERQVVLAHLVVGAHHAALQERPERLDVVGVDVAAHVLARTVVDGLVRHVLPHVVVGVIL